MNIIEEKKLKELDKCLSKEIKNYDHFLLDQHHFLYDVFYDTYKSIEDNNYHQGALSYISTKETIFLVSSFLDTIDSNYKKEFEQDVKDNKIIIKEGIESSFKKNKDDTYTVNIKKSNSILDPIILAHEYLHKLTSHNTKKGIGYPRYLFSEMVSILGEFKIGDFLEENGYNKSDIILAKQTRLIILKNNIKNFMFLEPLISVKLDKEKLNNKIIKDFCGLQGYQSKEEINRNVKFYLEGENSVMTYLHSYGKVIATILHNEGISTEDFKGLIDNINTEEYPDYIKRLPELNPVIVTDSIKSEFPKTKELIKK